MTLLRIGVFIPITFMFNLSSRATNLNAWYSYDTTNWNLLIQRTNSDFFSGETVVRFDYPHLKAYVSVGFCGNSHLYIRFTNSPDCSVNVSYQGIANYYDNRKSAVAISNDDYANYSMDAFNQAINIFRQYKLWCGVGVITEKCDARTWQNLQQQVNQGYVEVESHSRTHLYPKQKGYNCSNEVSGSKRNIIGNLTLPYGQYVNVFLIPGGLISDILFSECIKAHYIFVRIDVGNCHAWATWVMMSAKQVLIYINGYSIRMGTQADKGTSKLAVLNSKFDSVYNAGGIYHLMTHPWSLWMNQSSCLQHLAYISNRLDVWYVSLGDLYTYHYAYSFVTFQSNRT